MIDKIKNIIKEWRMKRAVKIVRREMKFIGFDLRNTNNETIIYATIEYAKQIQKTMLTVEEMANAMRKLSELLRND